MKIIIPSKGRPKGQTLVNISEEIKNNTFEHEVFVFVQYPEYEQYKIYDSEKMHIVPIPVEHCADLDDATTRNYGLELIKQYYKERYVIFIDDDIMKVSTLEGKTFNMAFNKLEKCLHIAKNKYPELWLLSAKQPAPFMDREKIFINSGTPWVGFCIVDTKMMPEGAFLPTKHFGPQEITIPVLTVSTKRYYGSTSSVIMHVCDSTIGGMSDVVNTTSREEREKLYLEKATANLGKYVSVRKSKTLKMDVVRCNFFALKRDFGYITDVIEVPNA